MKRHTGILDTIAPDSLSAWDECSYMRVVEWENRPDEVKMQYKENDTALLEFLNQTPAMNNSIKNPVVRWTIDGALATYTTLVTAVAANATELVLEDASITAAGHVLIIPSTGEEIYVTSVNFTTNTATVVRGKYGPAFSILADSDIYVGAPEIGETGKLKDAHTTYPGDPTFNYITLMGYKFEMSTMQINAAMTSDWGTWDKYSMDTKYQVEMSLQNAMIFQHRSTHFDDDERQVYRGNGLIPQMSGNVLDLGDAGTNFLWGNVCDFVNPMFASELSSDEKDVFCGCNLWADMLTTSQQNSASVTEPQIDAKYGANTFTMTTNEGKRVNFRNVKSFTGQMAGTGLVLDKNNISGSQYDGLGPQWFLDLQGNDEILKREAGYFTSWETHIHDRTTMGLIRGDTQPLIQLPK